MHSDLLWFYKKKKTFFGFFLNWFGAYEIETNVS